MMTRRAPYVNILRTTVATFAAAVGGADAVTVLPFTASPKSGAANYKVSIAYASSGQQYTLSATPCGNDGASCPAGSASFTDGDCNVLTVNNLGQQGESGSKDVAFCWQK